jgi:hypothetical protein
MRKKLTLEQLLDYRHKRSVARLPKWKELKGAYGEYKKALIEGAIKKYSRKD